MFPAPSINSVVVAAGLGMALLSATYFKAPQLSISLIAALGASTVLYKYNKRPGKVKFYRIHSTAGLVDQTADILMQEWPNDYGDADMMFNRKASLLQSSVNLPCHLIAVMDTIKGREVVGHVALPLKPKGLPDSYKKFAKMVKVGVPLDSAKKAAKLAGFDPDLLDDIHSLETREEDQKHEPKEGALSSLVVKPKYRGYGIGKGMCAFALETAKELGIEKLIIWHCPNNVVSFLEKMGFRKAEGKRKDGVPRVRLHNHLSLDLNRENLLNAKEHIRRVSQ